MKVAVLSAQKFILNPLGDVGDVPGCNQLDAQSHVLREAERAAAGSEELPGMPNVARASGMDLTPCHRPPRLPRPPPVLTSKRMRKASRAAKMCQNWTV